jgi:hypothetical protein
MTTTLLITESRLRQFTDINDSLDVSLLTNAVREAQDISLQRLTGTKLYRKILADVADGSITGAYKTLLDDFIVDFLIYASYYEALEAIFLRPRNNGLLQPTGGDNSEAVTRDLYNAKRESVKSKREFYADKIVKYLVDNYNSYPELQENYDLHEQFPDFGSQFRSPIVFKRGSRAFRKDFVENTDIEIADSRYPWLPPPRRKDVY